MRTVVWSEQAQADVEEYLSYLEERNPGAAIRAAEEFDTAGQLLALHPYAGRVGREPTTREFSRPRWSKIIVYDVSDEQIEIVALLDPRQDI